MPSGSTTRTDAIPAVGDSASAVMVIVTLVAPAFLDLAWLEPQVLAAGRCSLAHCGNRLAHRRTPSRSGSLTLSAVAKSAAPHRVRSQLRTLGAGRPGGRPPGLQCRPHRARDADLAPPA